MSEITVLPWNEFLSCKKEKKQQYFSEDKVLILGDEPQLTNWPAVSSVKTLDDLEKVKALLCRKTLILLVRCGKHVPVGQRLNSRGRIVNPSDLEWWLASGASPWNESTYQPVGNQAQDPRPQQFIHVQFAVVVDTSHPLIQKQFIDGFRTAESFLKSNKDFCLEFDFNAILLDWWLNQGPKDWLRMDCMETAYCVGGRISITNTTQPCHGLDFKIWWTLCLPCYCLLAVPYKVWRSIICQIWDHQISITGRVRVVQNIEDIQLYQR